MAKPETARFGKFSVSIEDPDNPGTYIAPCGFTSKALTLSKNLAEVNIPDCDDPDAASWVGRDVQSLTASVTGEGVMAAEAAPMWMEFFESVESRSARVEIEFASGTLSYTGLMHLETLNPTADLGQRVNMSVSMQSDGEMVGEWEPVVAP